jgi:hypothetical protein
MVSFDRIDPVILGHILGQHRDLHAQMLSLRALCEDLAAPDSQRLAEVRGRLGGLRDYLRQHFEQEERGGFMEESIARMPRLSVVARDVLADHPRLLAEIDGLLERLPKGDISAAAWAAVRQDFAVFTDHLLAHERNENAVVQEGYNEDLGLDD